MLCLNAVGLWRGVAWRVCWPHAAPRDGELGRVRETELTALAKKRWGHGLVVVTRYPGAAGRGDGTRSLAVCFDAARVACLTGQTSLGREE